MQVQVPKSPHARRGFGIATVALLAVFVAGSLLFSGYGSTSGGEIAVVRNGGPLDNTKIRQIVDPSSGRTRIGYFSTMHKYPSTQRFYTIASDGSGDRIGVDVVQVPSADGIELGIEGQVLFDLNLDHDVLRTFDDRFGTRTFRGNDGQQRHAWDGNDGWSSFLDQIVRPVINNDLRISVGNYRCADLLPSCALVQNTSATIDPTKIGKGNLNLAKIETDIASSLESDLTSSMGGPYLQHVKFNLSKVTLPQTVQDAINTSLASFAKITQAQAEVQTAKAQAQANEQRQRGYDICKTCAQIDILKALPSGVTVFAPGSGTGLPLTTPVK